MTETGETARGRVAALSLGALGVVYGDIGTSPLYALRESLSPAEHGLALTEGNVLGVLSLIVWSLVLLVAIKYVTIILRADNDGEGGILALTTLVNRALARKDPKRRVAVVLGLFGAALLYGDGLITPAISVLSASEGLKAQSPRLEPFVVPFAVVVLIGLFLVQKKGTGHIGSLFGPVMLVWFGTLAVLGAREILRYPAVLLALDPTHGIRFFLQNGLKGFLVLGSVVLAVTGGEAVYADLGHFGARPIRVAWFVLVLPALLLNYFGQGALLLREPAALENPLFAMVPGVHGGARRARGPARARPRRQGARSDGGQLHPRTGLHHLDGQAERDGALARTALLLDAAERSACDGLLQDPAFARDRVRHPGGDLRAGRIG